MDTPESLRSDIADLKRRIEAHGAVLEEIARKVEALNPKPKWDEPVYDVLKGEEIPPGDPRRRLHGRYWSAP